MYPTKLLDLANPIFACTGMKFWIYMVTVIASLPKVIVFVALGTPSSEHSKGARAGKVIAIGVVVVITRTYTSSLCFLRHGFTYLPTLAPLFYQFC